VWVINCATNPSNSLQSNCRLYSQARKTADKLEAKRKKPPVDLKTGAALFKPSTGRAPLSNRNAPVIPVGNRLFDTRCISMCVPVTRCVCMCMCVCICVHNLLAVTFCNMQSITYVRTHEIAHNWVCSREWEDRKVGAKAQKEQEIKQTMTATHTNAASKVL
jgi:hypothetical protein